MSSAAVCGCDDSRQLRAVVTPGVGEKLDRLRAEAERQARDFAKYGQRFEAIEWATAADVLRAARVAKPVPFTNEPNLVALVDEADLESVLRFTWNLKRGESSSLYAYMSSRPGRRQSISLHRFLMGAQPGDVIDHINGNGLDCRRENLRVVSSRQNMQNMRSSKNQKRGGMKGVAWSKRDGYWVVHIRVGEPRPGMRSNRLSLGHYENLAEAGRAYDCAAIHYFGEYAATNFPREQYTDAIVSSVMAAIEARVRRLGGIK
jgi:hypothetical protein